MYGDAIAAAPDAPSQAYARRELAETLLHWGEIEAGAGELERVVALVPRDAATWHDLGVVRHHLGDDPRAIVALSRARDLAPGDQRPRIALAALYWKLGDRPRALAEYQALARLDLPPRVRDKVHWAIRTLSARPGGDEPRIR